LPLEKDSGQQFKKFLTKWVKKIPKKERPGYIFVFCRVDQCDQGDYLSAGIIHVPRNNGWSDMHRWNLRQKAKWPMGRIPKGFPRVIEV